MSIPPGGSDERLPDNWTHAGRVVRSAAHEINNDLGAILAYSELIAASATDPEHRRMAGEISRAARDGAAELETLTALVSRELSAVETIVLNDLLPRVGRLFRVELERAGSGIELSVPKDICAFPGVRTRITRALAHSVRYVATGVSNVRKRRIGLRLVSAADSFQIDIGDGANDGSGQDARMPAELTEAREHVNYHHGSFFVVAPEYVRIEVPRDTGLLKK